MSSVELPQAARIHLPGETGVWVFILGDMLMFALLFAVFIYYRSQDVGLFAGSQLTLNQTFGAFNTLLLLSSSWFVALGINAARKSLGKISARYFAATFCCALAFVVVKVFEYGEKFNAGIAITTNDFYMYYFMLTGIHLIHVVIGMGVLTFLWHTARSAELNEKNINVLESGASFWHMVDILWIVLFALFYLLR
ncbi:MAG: cytochrome c oxidase subunit 3 family protein [Proteobacteria bacterium]|nr:cytochrome c oxidase subunit 3 family protein [Pseudomonadota bacterium]